MYVKGKRKKQKNKASTLYGSLKCIVLQLFNVTNKFFAFFNNDITFRMRDQ